MWWYVTGNQGSCTVMCLRILLLLQLHSRTQHAQVDSSIYTDVIIDEWVCVGDHGLIYILRPNVQSLSSLVNTPASCSCLCCNVEPFTRVCISTYIKRSIIYCCAIPEFLGKHASLTLMCVLQCRALSPGILASIDLQPFVAPLPSSAHDPSSSRYVFSVGG